MTFIFIHMYKWFDFFLVNWNSTDTAYTVKSDVDIFFFKWNFIYYFVLNFKATGFLKKLFYVKSTHHFLHCKQNIPTVSVQFNVTYLKSAPIKSRGISRLAWCAYLTFLNIQDKCHISPQIIACAALAIITLFLSTELHPMHRKFSRHVCLCV